MRRLLCISNSIADTFKWRTSMGLTNHHIRHWSPYENPNKMRGLDELNNAIVWVDRPTLSSDHEMVLKMYRALGMREFEGKQRDAILSWLRADDDPTAVPFDDDRDDAIRALEDAADAMSLDDRPCAKVAALDAAVKRVVALLLAPKR